MTTTMDDRRRLAADYRATVGDEAIKRLGERGCVPNDKALNAALRKISKKLTDDNRWAMRLAWESAHDKTRGLRKLTEAGGRHAEVHDSDLKPLARDGDQEAQRVLELRDKSATEVRLGLARVYGVGTIATFHSWSAVPCLTPDGRLGVLDTAHGTAWSTPTKLDVEAASALGLIDQVEAGVNNGGGSASVEVSADGSYMRVGAGRQTMEGSDYHEPAPTMPAGWRQIGLPTWRSAYPELDRYVDTRPLNFKPETWTRPTLVACGLMTCYGTLGDAKHGEKLLQAHGWDGNWPWGVPEWIDGTSVSVIDALIDKAGHDHCPGVHRTKRPRGSDADELVLVRQMLDASTARFLETVDVIRQSAEAGRVRSGYPSKPLRKLARECLLQAAELVLDDPSNQRLGALRAALHPASNETCWPCTGQIQAVLACRAAIAESDPWTAARALSMFGSTAVAAVIPIEA